MNLRDPALLRPLLFAAALAGTVAILVVFSDIFLPLLVGWGIAYLFDPAVTWFERRYGSRLAGVVVVSFAVIALAVGLMLFLIPAIAEQVNRVSERLPDYNRRLQERVLPGVSHLQNTYPELFNQARERGLQALRENLPRLVQSLVGWIGMAFSSLLSFFLFFLNLILVPVFAIYLLLDYPRIKLRIEELIPIPYRRRVVERLGEVDRAVSAFLRGQVTIAGVLAVINAIGLWLLGVPMGLALGILAGLANMIPYMALVVGLAPALLLCWVEHQSLARLLGVVGVFSGAQLLEGMYLSPKILGKNLDLHPVWVLIAVIAGGSLFGFLGILIALPVAAALQVFLHHWIEAYRDSRIYLGDSPSRPNPS